MRNLMLSFVLASSSLLTACGGSFGGAVQAISQVAIASSPAFDGYIRSDGLVNTNLAVSAIGDTVANTYYRAHYGFSLAQIPAGAQVTGARLRLTQVGDQGLDLGARLIEHIALGGVVNFADFASAPITANGGILLPTGNPNEWEIDVSQAVAFNVANGHARSDFRLRFAIPFLVNADNDFETFATGEHASAGMRPELIVTYIEP